MGVVNLSKIIIFTQSYNAGKTLDRAIKSILSQTFSDWKYYIFDNGSTDNTSDILAEYAAHPKIIIYGNRKNDLFRAGKYLMKILRTAEAEWLCWLDADDEYKADFLENMYAFATANKLDIAVCGYEMIDGISGAVSKKKVMDENLVLEGADFADRFVEYRGFTLSLWAKLLPIRNVIDTLNSLPDKCANFSDSLIVLNAFQSAKKAGILSQVGYTYYRYPRSLSHTFNPRRFEWDMYYYHFLRRYLIKSYAKREPHTKRKFFPHKIISNENACFLYAILLSLIQESFLITRESEASCAEKLILMNKYFTNNDVLNIFRIDPDPQFRNFVTRAQFAQEILNWVLSQTPDNDTAHEAKETLEQCLKNIMAQGDRLISRVG